MAFREVTVDELAVHLAAGGRLVDVREPAEYAEAHIEGAVLVPLATVPDRFDVFAGAVAAHVICRVGGRSAAACEYLAQHGVEAVNVAGGMTAWAAAGHEIATGDA